MADTEEMARGSEEAGGGGGGDSWLERARARALGVIRLLWLWL
jgi:hypothetical protein